MEEESLTRKENQRSPMMTEGGREGGEHATWASPILSIQRVPRSGRRICLAAQLLFAALPSRPPEIDATALLFCLAYL